ncbi:MAG: RNA-directed DNA polymerase [Anaerolineae bacterium]
MPIASARAPTLRWTTPRRWRGAIPTSCSATSSSSFPRSTTPCCASVIARKIADPQTLWLVDRILAGGEGVLDQVYQPVTFPGDDLFALQRPRGLPIGNLTSQFWANVYLNELDQFVKRRLRCAAYLRYVDDFLLFAASKAQLWAWKAAIQALLADLRLTLHQRESTVYPVASGIPFLGFRVYPDHRRLKRRNGVAFARRLRIAYRAVDAGAWSHDDLRRRIKGWIAHASHGDTWRLRRSLLAVPVPRRSP